jgi:hypothetical protein
MSGLLRASRKRRVVGEGSGPAAGVGFETGCGSRKRLGAVEVQPDAVATTETAGSASATESASAGCGHADIVDVNVGLVLSLFECEALYLPARAMLDGHPTITPRKRAVLLDWLMELCSEFRFTRATFHLSVNICDRFMSLVSVGAQPSWDLESPVGVGLGLFKVTAREFVQFMCCAGNTPPTLLLRLASNLHGQCPSDCGRSSLFHVDSYHAYAHEGML